MKIAVPPDAQTVWLVGCVVTKTAFLTVRVAASLGKKKFSTQINLTPLFARETPDTPKVVVSTPENVNPVASNPAAISLYVAPLSVLICHWIP